MLSLIAASVIAVVVLAALVRMQSRTASDNAAYPPIDTIFCQKSERDGMHIHVHLSISIDGKRVPIPANVGIAFDGSCLYRLHTHDASGVIHLEGPGSTTFTLKHFLDIWKGQFAPLGYPGELDSSSGWQVYVDGKPFCGDFRTIPLHDHTLITLAFNSPGVSPDTSYPWNGLSQENPRTAVSCAAPAKSSLPTICLRATPHSASWEPSSHWREGRQTHGQ